MSTDPLDDLLQALAGPARPDELAGEAEAVASLARSVHPPTPSEEPPVISKHPRRMRIATVVAAGVIGFAGVAAAGPAVFDDAPPSFVEDLPAPPPQQDETTTTAESTTTSTIADETTTTASSTSTTSTSVESSTTLAPAPAAGAEEDLDDPSTAFDENLCAEGNHGKTVSSVAQATESGPGKGAIVSEAAQSSCGKDWGDDEADDVDDVDDADDAEVDEIDDDDDDVDEVEPQRGKPEDAGNRGNGRGKKDD